MWQKISQIILRNRLIISVFILGMTVFLGANIFGKLKLDNKFGAMLPKDSPAQRDYLKFKERYGEDGGTLIIAVNSEKLYDKDVFEKWIELGNKIKKFDAVKSVISEAQLISMENIQEDKRFRVKEIFQDSIISSQEEMDSLIQRVRDIPIYNNFIYSDSGKISMMIVSIKEEYLQDLKRGIVVINIEELAKEYEDEIGKIYFSGLPHIRIVVGKKVMGEMYIFIALAISVTSLLLLLFFRSIKVVLICNLVVAVAVIWSLGTIGLFGFKLSILMALIPPLMIVIGIPNCVFLLNMFHREVKIHGNKVKALSRVIHKIGNATFLTNLTTALGFSTFVFTNSDKLIEFGIIASLNIMVVFFLSITIIPIITSNLKAPKGGQLKHLDRNVTKGIVDGFVWLVRFHRKWVYGVAVLLLGLSIWGITKVEATGNLTGDLPSDDPIVTDLKKIESVFHGSIPFEILINYKEKNRLLKKSTLKKVEELQDTLSKNPLFSKSLSVVDFVKWINMSFYNNDPTKYVIPKSSDKKYLSEYIENMNTKSNQKNNPFSLDELVDTAETTMRVRLQMKDIGSYEIAEIKENYNKVIDAILNPERTQVDSLLNLYTNAADDKKDTVLAVIYSEFPAIYNDVCALISNGNDELQYEFDLDPNKIYSYHKEAGFGDKLKEAADKQYFDFYITGISVIASEGTQYLVYNLLTSLAIAVFIIAIIMAILFRSWRMVIVSLIPNFLPLLVTAAIMGFFQIPIKPSTILVFSIAFGISVDDTIHFLAKYRLEIKHREWDLNQCVINALSETGLSMFYTSIILFFGFSVFAISEFGGTKALGILVSLTLLVAMITNLVLLPSLLLSLQRRVTTKAFKEPYIEIYDEEEDIELEELEVTDKGPEPEQNKEE
ncbi:MAG: MMPL family transporter [Crocinitomicaceae bacterium]|nr:MMPL family transporter [Crocinitomicaceae bacterium]